MENEEVAKYKEALVQKTLEELNPGSRKRIEALLQLQGRHDALHKDFMRELDELEVKYQKLYAPLYADRSDIITGTKRVPGVSEAEDGDTKGLPGFWLRVLEQSHMDIIDDLNEKDREALEYLTDIKSERLPRGFRIQFFFAPNPFFTNEVLEKTYYLAEERDLMDEVLEKSEGTPILWREGASTMTAIQMVRPKKGKGPPREQVVKVPSFFSFFSPPQIPEDVELDEKEEEELEASLHADFEAGSLLYRKILPHAVDWFTGVGPLDMYGVLGDDEYDDDDD